MVGAEEKERGDIRERKDFMQKIRLQKQWGEGRRVGGTSAGRQGER